MVLSSLKDLQNSPVISVIHHISEQSLSYIKTFSVLLISHLGRCW